MGSLFFFLVDGKMPDTVFETLVGVCSEMKIKIDNSDSANYTIECKTKSTMLRWGVKLYIQVIRDISGSRVEIWDASRLSDGWFTRELYKKFVKYMPSVSPLAIDITRKAGPDNDAQNFDTPLSPVGPSMQEPDSDHDAAGDERACIKCGATSPKESRFCIKCGHTLAGCPSCGYVSEEKLAYCIKCGTKLGNAS